MIGRILGRGPAATLAGGLREQFIGRGGDIPKVADRESETVEIQAPPSVETPILDSASTLPKINRAKEAIEHWPGWG